MSVKIQLEKNGELINGFTGFSWTTFFLDFGFQHLEKNQKVLVYSFYFYYKNNYNLHTI